ncbi:MAG: transposase [Candidatus Udaeobacter sp.]
MTADDRKKRLHRLELIYVRSPIYFVTACIFHRHKVLASEAIHEAFVEFALQGPAHGAWVGNYVLMPDHLHAFVATDDQQITLSAWMKSLKNLISKTLRRQRVVAPHWQKAFFDHLLRSSESYSEKWNYVRENPVRAGLVNTADEWKFMGEIFRLEYRSD